MKIDEPKTPFVRAGSFGSDGDEVGGEWRGHLTAPRHSDARDRLRSRRRCRQAGRQLFIRSGRAGRASQQLRRAARREHCLERGTRSRCQQRQRCSVCTHHVAVAQLHAAAGQQAELECEQPRRGTRRRARRNGRARPHGRRRRGRHGRRRRRRRARPRGSVAAVPRTLPQADVGPSPSKRSARPLRRSATRCVARLPLRAPDVADAFHSTMATKLRRESFGQHALGSRPI